MPEGLHDFLDYDSMRGRVYDGVMGALTKKYPLENTRYRLELGGLKYSGPSKFSIKDQKKAILQRKSIYRPIKGTWNLIDKATNKSVDQRKSTIMHVPHLTSRGTYILRGNEYTVANQMRLRSGVYARKKENGELESHFNVRKGGPSFRVFMEPKTGVFRMQVGQAKLKMFPILKGMGVSDADMTKWMGPNLFKANVEAKDDQTTIRKVWDRMSNNRERKSTGENPPTKEDFKTLFDSFELDPEVTKRTLGTSYSKVSPEVLMRSMQKLININSGKEGTDDRDSLAYQETWSADDFFKERISKDSGRIASRALWKATLRGNLGGMQQGVLNPQMDAVFFKAGVAQPLEEINPIDALDQNLRLTRLGEGGLSGDRVTDEARNVNPSQFMFVDPVRTPESGKIGVDSRVTVDTLKGDDRQLYTKVRNLATGTIQHLPPAKIVDAAVAFPGEIAKARKEGRKYVKAMVGGRLQYAKAKDVAYEAPSHQGMFTLGSNMVPLVSAIKGGRLLMGAKMASQALPLSNPEAPLVRSADSDGKSFYNKIGGRMGATHAKMGGEVMRVTRDSIIVKQQDNELKEYELYDNFPLNRKTFLSSVSKVKKGDVVKPGQMLARSNFTDDEGATALGKNLRVAYVPYKGLNFEDAIVISETASKKMASEHMYTEKMDLDNMTGAGTGKFMSIFPNKYTKAQLDNMSDDGVIKPGSKIMPEDPLILAVERKTSKGAGMLYRGAKSSFGDSSVRWTHHTPGVVTDVWSDKHGVKVAVKTFSPSEKGDKMSGRYGDKGVIAKVIPDDQMPMDADGNAMEVLLNPLGVISRVNPAQMIETVLGKIAAARGKPYNLDGFSDQDLVEFAIKEMETHGVKDTEDLIDPEDGRTLPKILTGRRYMMKLHHTAECFDDQTDVLTERGWVRWKDVTPHDRLATTDTRGNKLFFEKPLHLFNYDYDGTLYAFSSKYLDYAVTPNHNLWCKSYGGQRTFGLRQAAEMHGRRFKVKQFGFDVQCPGGPANITIGDRVHAWDDFCELVGWWVTEGCIESSGSAAMIYQSSTANPGKVTRIEALLSGLSLKWTHYKVAGVVMGFRIADKSLVAYLSPLGLHSEYKRVPRAIISGPLSGCRRAIDAMLLGDGSHYATYDRFTSTSKQLIDDFQEMAIRTGAASIIHTDNRKQAKYVNNPHYHTAYSASYTTSRDNSMVDGDRNPDSFELRPYVGKVYCAEMRSGLLYVRRDGKPMLSGNSKESGRGLGAYSSDGTPAKGQGQDSDNPKRVGSGEMQALLSHGAIENIKDIKIIRGQRNDDYWRAMSLGYPPPSPNMPNAYKKFLAMMRGAGINTKKKGNYMHLTALTDNDINKMSSGAINKPETVKWLSQHGRGAFGEKSLDPIEGGLFDRGLTGGHGGNRWSHIKLSEPMPQPAMEDPIRRLLGMTKKQYMDVIGGTTAIPGSGTGGQGIFNALSRIKLEPEIQRLTDEVKTGSSAVKRDAAVKKLGYLQAMKANGTNPSDLVVTKVPVLPPIFRPITANSKFNMVAGINLLYMDLMNADKNLGEMTTGAGQDSELTNAARLNVYNSVKAITGLGDPIKPERVQQKVRGVLGDVFGSSPKMGLYQRRLLGSSVDLSGRATVTPNPSLDMDQIGIPEDQAWKLYAPFITRRLIQGMGDEPDARAAAIKMVVDRTPKALEALEKEMENRPVLSSRAPALHRYSVMAFKPVIATGRTLQLSPATVTGFNADFDGDAMNFHVVVSDKAVEEAKKKLLPSQNLRSPADFGTLWQPRQEFLQGLYSASTQRSGRRVLPKYGNAREVIAAFNRGENDVQDVVSVKD